MSEQTGGAKIDEIHTLATDGFTHLMGDELLSTAKVAKQLVKDIKGNPDTRVNALATQLNTDADKLIQILGGPAAASKGFFSGLFSSTSVTPSPSPSIPTTSASGSSTTQLSAPASEPQILPVLTTSLPASTMSGSTTTPPPPPPPSGKKEYKSTKNWLQKIDIEQRLQLDLEVAMNTVLTEPTDTKKPELENARTLLLNKRKEIQGLKDIIETKDRVAKEDFIKKVKEYTESFKAYNKTLRSLDKRSFGNYFRTLTTTRKSNINKMTRPPPNEGNSNTFSATNPSRNTSQNTEKSPSFGNRLRRTFRRGNNKLTSPRDPALNMPRPAGPQTLTLNRPVEKERPVESVFGVSPLEKGEGSRQLPGLPQSDNLGSINPSNSSSKTPRNFASMIFSNKPEEAKKFREKLREKKTTSVIPGQGNQETPGTSAASGALGQQTAETRLTFGPSKPRTPIPSPRNKATDSNSGNTAASSESEEDNSPSIGPLVPRNAQSIVKTGPRNFMGLSLPPPPPPPSRSTPLRVPLPPAPSSQIGNIGSQPSSPKNNSRPLGLNGPPSSSSSSSSSNRSGPSKSTSSNLSSSSSSSRPRPGLNGNVPSVVEEVRRLEQQRRNANKTPTIVVPTTPYGPVYGISGVQPYTKPKGGARNTRKYSKKQAHRQTRRG